MENKRNNGDGKRKLRLRPHDEENDNFNWKDALNDLEMEKEKADKEIIEIEKEADEAFEREMDYDWMEEVDKNQSKEKGE